MKTTRTETPAARLYVYFRDGHELTSYPAAEGAAKHVPLAIVACPVARELYGYAAPVLDEEATLRRVTPIVGCAMTQDEREAALGVIRARFEAYCARAS